MTTLLELTYGGLFLGVLAQQAGLPIPSVVFLMAGGALSSNGRMSPSIVVFLGVLGCLAGDTLWFWIGRKWGSKAIRLLCRFSADPRHCSTNAKAKFRRYGLALLCVAKFVPGMDAVMPPLAGVEAVPFTAFLALDTVGSLLWSSVYVGLGYLFASELDVAIRWVQHFGTVLGMVIGLPLALYAGWRGLVLVRMIRQLRLRLISAPLLARKLKSDRNIAVLDLVNFEEETENEGLQAIPGALLVDPSRLWKSANRCSGWCQIILYSSSGKNAVSARAAVGLKRIGVDKVWVLEGGLKAWREHGFPVSRSVEDPEVVAARYGVKLPDPLPAGSN
jgi:membrane protein DedA with SNARE-associated domain/rhodanese-related sulfurtransferase